MTCGLVLDRINCCFGDVKSKVINIKPLPGEKITIHTADA